MAVTLGRFRTFLKKIFFHGTVLTQVCWFDDRAGRQPVGVTDFLQSHKDAVYTVRYTISQSVLVSLTRLNLS